MSSTDIASAKNPDLRGSLAALRRAAAMARQIAIQTDTAIVIFEGGQQSQLTAEQLRKQQTNGQT